MRTGRVAAILAAAGVWAAGWCAGQTKQWDLRFGGDLEDEGEVVVQTEDGGYAIAGSSKSNAGGDKSDNALGGYDYWLVKTDAAGTRQWDKRFGGTADDEVYALRQTVDGGYLIGGTSLSGAGGDKSEASWGNADYWVVKTDAAGNKQWDRRFGGVDGDYLQDLVQTADGGYLLGGQTFSGASGDKTEATRGWADYWIVKLDAAGNKQWDRRFGGADLDIMFAVRQTSDGGYVLGGSSASPAGGDKSEDRRGSIDYWIVKIDAWGNKQWDRRFGGSDVDQLMSLQPATDGGYILGGLSVSGPNGDKTEDTRGLVDYWVVKTDAAGNKLWDRRFGGAGMDILTDLVQAPDRGYLLAGFSDSVAGGDKTEDARGAVDFWLVKIAPDGNKVWDRRFGGALEDVAESVANTTDGGCILGGRTRSAAGGDKTQDARGQTDFWLVKVAYDGALALDAYEPDDAWTKARLIKDGQTQRRNIHVPGNEDWARFRLTRTRKVLLRTGKRTGLAGGDTEMWLYGPNSATKQVSGGYSDNAGGTKWSKITATYLRPGTYYVRVRKKGNDAMISGYTLFYDAMAPVNAADRYERDNTVAAAKKLVPGVLQHRSIHAVGNADWAKFTLAAPQTVTLRTGTRQGYPGGDTQIYLYKRGRLTVPLARNDNAGGTKWSKIVRNLSAGTYYVRVVEKGNNGKIPGYTLLLETQ